MSIKVTETQNKTLTSINHKFQTNKTYSTFPTLFSQNNNTSYFISIFHFCVEWHEFLQLLNIVSSKECYSIITSIFLPLSTPGGSGAAKKAVSSDEAYPADPNELPECLNSWGTAGGGTFFACAAGFGGLDIPPTETINTKIQILPSNTATPGLFTWSEGHINTRMTFYCRLRSLSLGVTDAD